MGLFSSKEKGKPEVTEDQIKEFRKTLEGYAKDGLFILGSPVDMNGYVVNDIKMTGQTLEESEDRFLSEILGPKVAYVDKVTDPKLTSAAFGYELYKITATLYETKG